MNGSAEPPGRADRLSPPRPGRRGVTLAAGVAVAALAIALVPPAQREPAALAALVAAGIAGSWFALRRSSGLLRSTPERFEAALQRSSSQPSELPGLRVWDTAVRMAVANAFGVELLLKPRLRELAAWRLLRERGVDADRSPDLARQLLGERLWRLIEPAPVRPDNDAPGEPLFALQAAIADLERL